MPLLILKMVPTVFEFLSFRRKQHHLVVWYFQNVKRGNKDDINGKRGKPISVGSQTSKD